MSDQDVLERPIIANQPSKERNAPAGNAAQTAPKGDDPNFMRSQDDNIGTAGLAAANAQDGWSVGMNQMVDAGSVDELTGTASGTGAHRTSDTLKK